MCTREICKCCDESVTVGFSVPDDIWEKAAGRGDGKEPFSVLCLRCFTRRADRLLLKWDKEIQFWPVSLVSHFCGVEGPPPEIKALFLEN